MLLRFVNQLMEAHIDECLLVKELLVLVADHLLGKGLDTEASIWLDELCADGKLTALLHLSQILIMFRPMLGV